jgi:EthD domain
MKHVIFLEASGPAPSLHAWLLDRFSPPARERIAVVVNLVQNPAAPSPWHAVLEVWGDDPAAHALMSRETFENRVSRHAAYRVTELVEKDIGLERQWPTMGPKLVVPWIGRAELTSAELRRHWDEHVPLANRIHVGVTRYVRNWVETPVRGDATVIPPYQGIAMQSFPSERDLRERSFDTPASVQVILDDVAEFIAEHVVLQVIEYCSSPAVAGSPIRARN